jgi:SAM-dependent methyltransferase
VGRADATGPAAAGVTGPADQTGLIRAAYDAAAEGWDRGPGPLYSALARSLVEQSGVEVSGRRVLDLGAGTGAAGSAAAAAGAQPVVAVDIAPRMLTRCTGRLRPVAADMAALPFRNDSFDLTIAAFCLSHVASLPGCLREVRRVSAALAASAFAPGWSHPAKGVVEAVLARHGYRPPGWYEVFKRDTEPQATDPAVLRAAAAVAGFTRIEVTTVEVVTELATPADLAAWRLGMAHVAPFVAALKPAGQGALRQAAQAAVAEAGCGSLQVGMVVLRAGC